MNLQPTTFSGFECLRRGKEIIKSLGVVFGDIGTSPIYTIFAIFTNFLIKPTFENVVGIVSLIIWTLITLVSIEYAWLAMSLGKKGEGGTIVLRELLTPLVRSPRQITLITILSFVGISLFFGDGVITPAISILSAVEGVLLIPGCKWFVHYTTVTACAIAIMLFASQKRGTERLSIAFGPIMVVWFGVLAVSGIASIIQQPAILMAINPLYGIRFILHNGLYGFLVLSGVILCATGGEALYADMGHLGRRPIRQAWYFVFIVLVLNYMGQGAFLMQRPYDGIRASVLYEMITHQVPMSLYIVFLILSLIATIIASQALISGMFSIMYQSITTNIIPMFKVDYTSSRLRSQVYIQAVNWTLMLAVLMMILMFKESSNLADAYGFSVTGTMVITAIMMTWIFVLRRNLFKAVMSVIALFVATSFFLANINKIPEGGYWSIIIALIPFCLILIYVKGQHRLVCAMQPKPIEVFLEQYQSHYQTTTRLNGTALFFVRDIKLVPPYAMQTMFKNHIMYEDNILISVITRDDPFGVIGFFKGSLAPGLRLFEIHMGYMEMLDIEKILRNAGIDATVIFYGLEEIVTKNLVWKVFAFIKHISPSFVHFYKLPSGKLHGVVTSVDM